MRIFVAYGFGDTDRWVKEQVFPLVQAFGSEPVGGEGLWGQAPPDGVRERISSCEGLIAFTTRRVQAQPHNTGQAETHLWVQQELSAAMQLGINVLEVRETGLDLQEGMAGKLHRISYDPNKPIDCFVELASALGEWHRSPKAEFLLIRDSLYQDLFPFINQDDNIKCQYRIYQRGGDSGWKDTRVIQRSRRLYLFAPKLPSGSRIQTRLVVRGRTDRVFVSDEVEIDVDSIPVAEVVRGQEERTGSD